MVYVYMYIICVHIMHVVYKPDWQYMARPTGHLEIAVARMRWLRSTRLQWKCLQLGSKSLCEPVIRSACPQKPSCKHARGTRRSQQSFAQRHLGLAQETQALFDKAVQSRKSTETMFAATGGPMLQDFGMGNGGSLFPQSLF